MHVTSAARGMPLVAGRGEQRHQALDGGRAVTKLNALAVVVALCAAGSSHVTQAAEPTGTLTLACQGTLTQTRREGGRPDEQ